MQWKHGDPIPGYHYSFGPVVHDVDGKEVHYAFFEELPGCSAHGKTDDEALERLWEILPSHLENLNKYGAEIPDVLRGAPSIIPAAQQTTSTTSTVGATIEQRTHQLSTS